MFLNFKKLNYSFANKFLITEWPYNLFYKIKVKPKFNLLLNEIGRNSDIELI